MQYQAQGYGYLAKRAEMLHRGIANDIENFAGIVAETLKEQVQAAEVCFCATELCNE